VLIQIENLRSY